jgi:O-antigen/teichoic acid export membrane protein
MALRMGLGLVTFRLLYQGLTPEEFGFWSLLWSLFGYGILLDFGFGYAAQKRVAELSVKGEWEQLSRVLSTIFFFYLFSAAVLVALSFVFSGPLMGLFKVSPENRAMFERVMILFIAGIGVAFPLGIFPEVLQGQQRIATANNIAMAGMLANFVVVAMVVVFHWSFTVLVILALLCVLVPGGVACWLALRHMPGVRLRYAYFSKRQIVETSKFSLYAYLNMLSNVLRNKADQFVVSSVLSVSAVTPYQAGGKVGEMFGMLTRQMADVLSPTAAHLHAKGDTQGLREMLVAGMRYTVMAATPLYIVSALYIEGVIRVLTGDRQPTAATLWVGQLLLFWYYSLAITHWVYKRMYMMAGQERRMMLQGVAEAAVNLALSIGLTIAMGSIVGVALGSVIPTVLFGWGWLWRWAAKEAQLSPVALFGRVVGRTWLGSLPMVAVGLGFRFQPWWSSGSTTVRMLLEGSVVGLVGMAGLWRFALTGDERGRLAGKLRKRLGR